MNDEPESLHRSRKAVNVVIGIRLEQALKSAGIAEEDVCSELKISSHQWRAWCSGEQRVTATQLIAVATITGRRVAWFFSGDDNR